MKKLASVQYNAALAITGAIRGTSRDRIYQELGLGKRRWYRRLCLFWKIVNGKSPIYLKERIPNIQFSHNTERIKLFSKMRFNNEYYGNTLFLFCVNQWNNLNHRIRISESISLFKRSLLQFIRPSGSEVYKNHDSIGLKYLTSLRLEFSRLREHKFRYNFRDTLNSLCSCNLLESESVNNFFLLCPIYASQRKILLDSVFEPDAGIQT